jgi:hypothetical protein
VRFAWAHFVFGTSVESYKQMGIKSDKAGPDVEAFAYQSNLVICDSLLFAEDNPKEILQ